MREKKDKKSTHRQLKKKKTNKTQICSRNEKDRSRHDEKETREQVHTQTLKKRQTNKTQTQ